MPKKPVHNLDIIATFKKFVELNLAFKQCKFTVNFIDI
ncbi:hypothetical protein CU002_2812 [Enterococcus faecium]|nr:hypothetical protein [Enterococcus faecium]